MSDSRAPRGCMLLTSRILVVTVDSIRSLIDYKSKQPLKSRKTPQMRR